MSHLKLKQEKISLKCSKCGRILLPEDEGSTWGRCNICNEPVCFGCAHYVGHRKKSMYLGEYVGVLRLCRKCYKK